MKNLFIIVLVILSQTFFSCSKKEDVVPEPAFEVGFLFDFDTFVEQITDWEGNQIDAATTYAKFGEVIFRNASGDIRPLSIVLYTQDSPTKPKIMLSENSLYGAGLGTPKSLDPVKRYYSVPFYVTATEYRSNIMKRYKSINDFKSDENLTLVIEVIEGRTLRTITLKNDGTKPVVQNSPEQIQLTE